MRRILSFFLAGAFYLAAALGAMAQEDDKGFLVRSLQDALSAAGRDVRIDGFRGALSSEAAFDRMTIADDDGIWITLENVVLDWNRSALLRGRLEVERLTAARLDLPRLPLGDPDALPDAEAAPFALPDLPISVQIDTFAIDQITLGAPILGEAAALRVTASAALNGDEGRVTLKAERTDGKRGTFDVAGSLARSDSVLNLDLELSEGAEGIAARVLSLPGQPSVEMTIAGAGPLDDFSADVRVTTDGAERLAGQVTLGTQAPRRASPTPDRRIQADIGGDITALLAPRYRAFFGDDLQLVVDALLEGNGAIDVRTFRLTAEAARLNGEVRLNAEGWPERIDITGDVENPDGTPILLPVGGEGTTVQSVDLRVAYDAAQGDAITAAFDMRALALAEIAIDDLTLALEGTVLADAGRVGDFAGAVTFDAQGLAPLDPALAEALGTRLSGRTDLRYLEDQPLNITALDLIGQDFRLMGDATLEGIETGLKTALDMRLTAADLSRFSRLAGQELDGAAALALQGEVVPLGGQFDLKIDGETQDLALGIAQADAVLAGRTALSTTARRDETGTFLRDLLLENAALRLMGGAELRSEGSTVRADFWLNDISLVVPQYSGPIAANASVKQDASGWRVDAVTAGPYGAALTASGLATGPNAALDFTADIPQVQDFLEDISGAETIKGPLKAAGTLRNSEAGWRLRTEALGPLRTRAAIDGVVSPQVNVTFDLSVPELQQIVPQVAGPLEAQGQLRQTETGFFIDTDASGPFGAEAKVTGMATGPDMQLAFDVALPDVARAVPGVNGPLAATGTVRQTETGIFVDTSASGPYGATAKVNGLATGPDMQLAFDVAMPNVARLVPSVNGPLSASGVLRQTDQGIVVDTKLSGPYSSRASVDGLATGPQANLRFAVDMPNIGALVDNINGPLDMSGAARKDGTGWQVETGIKGPSGTQARVSGRVAESGTLNLDINGTAPLGLSRPFLGARDLQGQARFDLRVDGPAALSSVTGQITTQGATFSAPNLRLALQGIAADIRLAKSRAQIDLNAQASNGGSVTIEGGLGLAGALPADLAIALRDVVVIDPKLYRTTVGGALRVAGSLLGAGTISGQVNIGATEISVPSTGIISIGDIPAITHIGATRPVMATRRKAGLDLEASSTQSSTKSTAGFGLNVRVAAPNQIFVRGRGLDAELGGALTVTGTTNRVISAGRFDLQRGRLDILGKRFDLEEGSIQFQGGLLPYLKFVSTTQTTTGDVSVTVEGPADAPEVTFSSNPEAPQDEVIAKLLFGRNLSEISAIQALQLANAVATLAGRGGAGVIANLRQGFGLDDLDVTTSDSGATAVRAGKYISENVYTDVTAASDGTGEVSLNLDITSNLKGKATLGSDGTSGIGIFFEKDY